MTPKGGASAYFRLFRVLAQCQNIPGGIVVAVEAGATVRALVPPRGQPVPDGLTAVWPRTDLAGEHGFRRISLHKPLESGSAVRANVSCNQIGTILQLGWNQPLTDFNPVSSTLWGTASGRALGGMTR